MTTLELEPIARPSAALDLRKVDLADVALAQYGDWREDVKATKANLSTLVLDLSTGAKIKDARALRQRLIGDPLAAVRKVAAGIKSKMAQASKAVGAELELIEAAYTEADALILPQIEARETVLAAEAVERKRIEAARVQMHQERMATIGAYLTACQAPGMTAERIVRGIAMLQAVTFGPEWEEFLVPAANAQCATLEAMHTLHAQVLGREQENARQEAIRLENERRAAELAEQQARIDAQAAELRARAAEIESAERLQRERADCDRIAALPKQPEQTKTEATVLASATPPAVVQQALQSPPAAVALPVAAASRRQPATAALFDGQAADEPLVKLGDITAWMGCSVTAIFVTDSLKVAGQVRGSATLFPRAAVRDALVRHLTGLAA